MAIFQKVWNYNDITYLQLGNYYPKKWSHKPLTKEEFKYNEMLLAFKKGIEQEYFVEKVVQGLKEEIENEIMKKAILCIVPASTRVKTRNRFMTFCEQVCKLSGLTNGYDMITCSEDREAGHLGGKKEDILKHIEFKGDFRDKIIVLLDDISTTGYTIMTVAGKLKELKVKKVYMVILGSSIQKI